MKLKAGEGKKMGRWGRGRREEKREGGEKGKEDGENNFRPRLIVQHMQTEHH